jgi:hypothetical protein
VLSVFAEKPGVARTEGTVAVLSFVMAIWLCFGKETHLVLLRHDTLSNILGVSVVALTCSDFHGPLRPGAKCPSR